MEEIIELYKQGLSTPKITKLTGVKQHTIDKYLRINNIEKRDVSESKRKYSLDVNYFDKINTEKKAYFLGLLYADGWNANNKISIQLSEKDSYILEEFKKDIQYNGPMLYQRRSLKKPEHSDSIRLCISNKYLSNKASVLGLCQNKTKELSDLPNISADLIPHFIRGFFDGDGCIRISKKQLRFSIVGTENFLNNLNTVLSNFINEPKKKLTSIKHSYVKYLNFGSKEQIRKIYNYLYKDATVFFLRKKNKFEEGLNV